MVASNEKLMKEALQTEKTAEGLVNSDKFQRLMEGMPELYSSVSYVSKRYMESVLEIQRQTSEMAPGPDVNEVMNIFYGNLAKGDYLNVEVACDAGFFSVTKAPYGGKQILQSFMMMPIGMMAGIAAPSFVNARQSSQENAMINSLRQIDMVKEMWAMENNKGRGDEVAPEDIGVYLRGGKLPPLPQGGRYEINPIGENPIIILPCGEKVRLP